MNNNYSTIIRGLLAIVCCASMSLLRADEKLPASTTFEVSDGYVPGSIIGQKGWTGEDAASRVIAGSSLDSIAVLELSRGESWITHRLDVGNAPIVNIHFFAKPFIGSTPETGTQFSIDGAGVSFAQGPLGAQLFTYEINKSV